MSSLVDTHTDTYMFGQRLRHFRKAAGHTLAELGEQVGRPAPYLSQLENGHTEPKLSVIGELAAALGCTTADLLDPSAPSRRAELEVTILRAQQDPQYAALGLPHLKPSAKLPDDALEHLVALYEIFAGERGGQRQRQSDEAARANVDLRAEMRTRNNYFEHIEAVAADAISAVNYPGSGPLLERNMIDLVAHFGFRLERAQDLPHTARSVTDKRDRVIYIPPRNDLDTRSARSVLLQTLGHFALDHEDTDDVAAYLRQRVESNYFAAAVLAPEAPSVEFLRAAQREHDISIEDLKEAFYISYEMAAHRFSNLATKHLGLKMHFIRSDEQGVVWKAYENDDVPIPHGADGSIERQQLCRHWGTRMAFESADAFSLHYQFTDTADGEFWCVTYVEAGRTPNHAVTVGCRARDAKWFRGGDTDLRGASGCPDPTCCKEPSSAQRRRWEGAVWPSGRDRSHVMVGMAATPRPFSRFPGVDLVEVYDFLDGHRRGQN